MIANQSPDKNDHSKDASIERVAPPRSVPSFIRLDICPILDKTVVKQWVALYSSFNDDMSATSRSLSGSNPGAGRVFSTVDTHKTHTQTHTQKTRNQGV